MVVFILLTYSCPFLRTMQRRINQSNGAKICKHNRTCKSVSLYYKCCTILQNISGVRDTLQVFYRSGITTAYSNPRPESDNSGIFSISIRVYIFKFDCFEFQPYVSGQYMQQIEKETRSTVFRHLGILLLIGRWYVQYLVLRPHI